MATVARVVAPLLIVSPLFPPLAGGLPDHTDRLATVLSEAFEVSVLSSPGVAVDRPFRVAATVGDWHDADGLERAIRDEARGGAVLWQYVPHMYGRGGANLSIPKVLRRSRGSVRRQLVLAHEIRAPWSVWPHRAWYALAHRLMWRGIRRDADVVGISTAAWMEREIGEGKAGAAKFFLAPSPANLSVATVPPDHRANWLRQHGLSDARRVLGFFGSPGSGKQFGWVLEAWRASRRAEPATALVVVGGRVPETLARDEARWCPVLGYLAAGEASAALQAMDVLVLPFVDGVSERRSSFMAGLVHGLPIVTRVDVATGTTLRGSGAFVGVAGGTEAFSAEVVKLLDDPTRRGALGERARAWYRREYDWPRLAETIRSRLEA